MRIIHVICASLRVLRALAAMLGVAGWLMAAPANAQLLSATVDAPLPFPAESHDQAINCLSTAIVKEAGHEPTEGQQAVAQVIMNRVRTLGYPKTVCGVVYQGSERSTGCQFTFTCDGSLRRPMSDLSVRNAQAIAELALSGDLPNRVADATHYHASYVSPYWSHSLAKVGQIGAHIFYRSGAGAAPGRAMLAYAPSASAQHLADAGPPRPFLPWGLGLAATTGSTAPDTHQQP